MDCRDRATRPLEGVDAPSFGDEFGRCVPGVAVGVGQGSDGGRFCLRVAFAEVCTIDRAFERLKGEGEFEVANCDVSLRQFLLLPVRVM